MSLISRVSRRFAAVLFLFLVVAAAAMPSAADAQVTITSAHTAAAPAWTAWENYPIDVTGTCPVNAYLIKLQWGFVDAMGGDNVLGEVQFNANGTTWSSSYLQGVAYGGDTTGGHYYVYALAQDYGGRPLGDTTHVMTLTTP